jgi:hypothetical protein
MRLLKLTPVVFLLAGGTLAAQTVQTGAVLGTVKDQTGKPVSGAVVIIRSGQTERRAVTAENGTYRFPLLNVGRWDLTITHPGLQTRTARVQVKINDTQTANIQMAAVAEAIVVVTDTAKSLDVTTTNVATTLSAESINKLPRDMTGLDAFTGLLNQTPGVQTIEGTGEFYVRGALSTQNVLNIDGTSANQTMSNSAASVARLGSSQTPLEFVDSVEVVTGAFGAEYGALGGVVNALTKSGSNTWSGQLFYSMNFPNSQAQEKYNLNLDPPAQKPAIQDQYFRYGASVSGPLLKDKLFFFVGYQGYKDRIPPAFSGTNWNGLTSDNKHVNGPEMVNVKINWFINDNNQLIYSFSHSKSDLDYGHQYPIGSSSAGLQDSGITSRTTIQSTNLTWNWLAASNLYLVASVGNYQNPSRSWSNGPTNGTGFNTSVNDYRYFVTGPGRNAANKPDSFSKVAFTTGTDAGVSEYSTNPNHQYRLDLTWQLGEHQIKAGYLLQKTSFHSISAGYRGYSLYNPDTDYYTFDASDLEMTEMDPMTSKINGTLQSYYVKDIVELLPGLRLDAGLRYDPFKYVGAFGPFDGMVLSDYNSLGRQLQPRLGLVWDVENNGRKKFFAHWGRFFDNFSMSSAAWATTSTYRTYIWAEGTGFQYNPDYQGNSGVFTLLGDPYYTYNSGYVGKPTPRSAHLDLPHKDSFTLGGDWTFNDRLSFGGVWTYWDMKNVVEDSWFLNADGSLALPDVTGPDGNVLSSAVNQKVLWNPGPGPVTILDSDGHARTWISNFPKPKNRFINLNLHATYSEGDLSLTLNYDWSHHYGNVGGGISNNLATNAGNGESEDAFTQGTTKDFDFATSIGSGNDEATPVHVLKGSGSYAWHLGGHTLTVSPSFTWQTGLGLSAYVNSGYRYRKNSRDQVFAGDRNTPVLIDNRRCNMGYLPTSLITDLNIQDSFTFRGIRIVPTVAIMNLFNNFPIVARETLRDEGRSQSKSIPYVNYGLATGWHPGRSVTAGISFQF